MALKTLLWMAILLFSFYGWGCAVRRASRMVRGGWPVTVTLGLSAVVFLGGALNLARLALPSSLTALAVAGVLLSIAALKPGAMELAGSPRIPTGREIGPLLAMAIPTAAILCFVSMTLLSPRAYNYHDDFQKYFAFPVRMLETGTLYGSPLSGIGSQTQGGQAFLHAFLLLVSPAAFLNGLDAVAGLFLCLVLAVRFTGGRRDLLAVAVVCLLSVVFINPQVTNISALYMGSAVMMTAIALHTDVREMKGGAEPSVANPAVTGLLYATLIAFKPTFALFVALHLPAAVLAAYTATGKIRRSLAWGALAALWLSVFAAPWILLHAPHYLAGLTAPAGARLNALPPEGVTETLNLLSFRPVRYGASVAHYTWLMVAVAIAGTMAAGGGGRSEDSRIRISAHMTAAAAGVGATAYLILLVVFAPLLDGYATALRYSTPFAIGIAPAVFGLTAFHLARSARAVPRTLRMGLPLAIAVLPVLSFWPSLRDRARQALESGSVLAFSSLARDPLYLEYNWDVLNGAVPLRIADEQAMVPAGEPLTAWINAPFYLDYARNPIADVEPAGLATSWAAMPRSGYVIWEYSGFATRSQDYLDAQAQGPGANERLAAVRTIEFTRRLESLRRSGKVLHDDGSFAVFRLNEDGH